MTFEEQPLHACIPPMAQLFTPTHYTPPLRSGRERDTSSPSPHHSHRSKCAIPSTSHARDKWGRTKWRSVRGYNVALRRLSRASWAVDGRRHAVTAPQPQVQIAEPFDKLSTWIGILVLASHVRRDWLWASRWARNWLLAGSEWAHRNQISSTYGKRSHRQDQFTKPQR